MTDTHPSLELTEAERQEIRRYHRSQLTCDLLDRALDLAYLALAAFVLAVPYDRWLTHSLHLERPILRLSFFFLTLTLLHFAVSFGLSFYAGFVVEHRFGMSRQSLGRWFAQYFKRIGLTIALGWLIVLGLYAMIWTVQEWWWLLAAIAFFGLSVIIGQLFPVLILPLFQKFERLDDAALNERFHQLAHGTGLTIEGVYRLRVSEDTAKANAQLAGVGSTRRVLLDDTLLDQFSEDELAVIFAHEVGHHVHRHIPKLVGIGVLYSTAIFLISDYIMAQWITRVDGQLDYANFPIYALPMFNLVFTAASNILEPVQNFISRYFERQADRYALSTTGLHSAFRSAFEKLAKLNKATVDPPWLEVVLFHSHPPIAERIKTAGLL